MRIVFRRCQKHASILTTTPQLTYARNAAGSLILRVLATTLGVAINVLLARTLGAADLGVYSYSFAWVAVLTVPTSFGLADLAVRETAIYSSIGRWPPIRGLLRWSATVMLFATLPVALIAATVAWYAYGSSPQFAAMVVALSTLPLSALTNLRQGVLRGLGHILIGQLPETLIRPAVLLLLLLTPLAVLDESIPLLVAMVMAACATVAAYIVGNVILRRRASLATFANRAEYYPGPWFRSSLPFLSSGLLFIVNSRADLIILGLFQSSHAIGTYAVASSIAMVVGFLLSAANTAIAPTIASLAATNQRDLLESSMRTSNQTVMVLSLPIAIVLIAFASPILGIFGQDFRAGRPALILLTIGQLLNIATGSVGQLLNMTGHARETAHCAGLGAVVNVSLCLILIPHWSLLGAALAMLVSTATWNALLVAYSYRLVGYATLLGFWHIRRAK